MTLALRDLRFALASFELVLDLEMAAPVTGVFGPSGAGKTTLLDLVAGVKRPRSGRIEWNGRVLADGAAGVWVPAPVRRIGYVPQDLALFPHLSVEQNLKYGWTPERERKGMDWSRVVQLLELEPLVPRSVGALSGGEKQRVALGRALLAGPELLLLDEPLASLDRRLKTRILPYLERVHGEFGVPMLYVSHDAEELRVLCGEVFVLDQGRVTQRGRPEEVLEG